MPVLTSIAITFGINVVSKLFKAYLESVGAPSSLAEPFVDTVAAKATEKLAGDPPERTAQGLDALAHATPEQRQTIIEGALQQSGAAAASAELRTALACNAETWCDALGRVRPGSTPDLAGSPTIPPSLLPRTPADLLRLLPILRPTGRKPGDTLYRGPGAGKLTLVRLRGIGAFSEVWETRNAVLESDNLAVKVFTHPQAQKFVGIELKNMQRIRAMMRSHPHPGIVPIVDVHLEEEPPSLVYPLVDGTELHHVIRRWHGERGGPEWHQAARMMLKLARILDHCHTHGIIHRDVKPQNILVSADGALHLTDFGLSQATGAAALDAAPVRGSMSYLKGSGTPGYASPEQMSGRILPADVRDDVYSLGVLGYEMLTNELPGGGLTPGKMRRLAQKGVPEAFVNLLSDCLEDREERLADAGVVVKGLEALLGQDAAASVPVPVSVTPATPHSRSPAAAVVCPAPADVSRPLILPLPKGLTLELMPISAGSFTMGSPAGEEGRMAWEDQVQVTLTKPFWMGRFPVTQEQYEAVTGGNPSHFSGRLKNPVEQVSWDDAVKFCQLVMQKLPPGVLPDGYKLSLPSEAQWEHACRAGSKGDRYGPLDEIAWYYDNSSQQTQPVGLKLANAWGLHDMLGNVWEWCGDWFDEKLLGGRDPQGPPSGSIRVIRGGSWRNGGRCCRSADRDWNVPGLRYDGRGFRVAAVPADL